MIEPNEPAWSETARSPGTGLGEAEQEVAGLLQPAIATFFRSARALAGLLLTCSGSGVVFLTILSTSGFGPGDSRQYVPPLVMAALFGSSVAFAFVTKALASRTASRHAASGFARTWVAQLRAEALVTHGPRRPSPAESSRATARITERIATMHARGLSAITAETADQLRIEILEWIKAEDVPQRSFPPGWSSDNDAFARLHNNAMRAWAQQHDYIGFVRHLARLLIIDSVIIVVFGCLLVAFLVLPLLESVSAWIDASRLQLRDGWITLRARRVEPQFRGCGEPQLHHPQQHR